MAKRQLGFGRFLADQDGAATVEFVLWLPAFLYLFILITDFSFVYHGKTQTMRAMQDGNRALSIGAIVTEEAVEDRIASRMSALGYRPQTVDAVVDSSTGIVTTSVAVPVRELMAVGSIPSVMNFEVRISASHYLEQ